jgi:hypothetical protein
MATVTATNFHWFQLLKTVTFEDRGRDSGHLATLYAAQHASQNRNINISAILNLCDCYYSIFEWGTRRVVTIFFFLSFIHF